MNRFTKKKLVTSLVSFGRKGIKDQQQLLRLSHITPARYTSMVYAIIRSCADTAQCAGLSEDETEDLMRTLRKYA